MNDDSRKVINRLAGRNPPKCPNCGQEIDVIYTDVQVHIYYVDGDWVKKESEYRAGPNFICPECLKELSPDDLDKLGVPNGVR